MTCPCCKESARFVDHRPKTFVSLLGVIRFKRGYYHCADCHQGQFPWDKTLRLSPQSLTLAAQEVVALAGSNESFCKVADRTLEKMSGLRLSESTVERTKEAAGDHRARMYYPEYLKQGWQIGSGGVESDATLSGVSSGRCGFQLQQDVRCR